MANNGVLRAWSLPASGQPFEERWSAAERQLMEFGAIMPLPMSDRNLARAYDMIKELQPAPPPPDTPALAEAKDEYWNLRRRYHCAWCECRELQKQIRRVDVRGQLFQLLANVPDNWDAIHPMMTTSVDEMPRFTSVSDARDGVREMGAKVTALEGFRAELNGVLAAHERSRNPDCAFIYDLLMKLFSRIQLLEQSVSALADAVHQPPAKQRKVK